MLIPRNSITAEILTALTHWLTEWLNCPREPDGDSLALYIYYGAQLPHIPVGVCKLPKDCYYVRCFMIARLFRADENGALWFNPKCWEELVDSPDWHDVMRVLDFLDLLASRGKGALYEVLCEAKRSVYVEIMREDEDVWQESCDIVEMEIEKNLSTPAWAAYNRRMWQISTWPPQFRSDSCWEEGEAYWRLNEGKHLKKFPFNPRFFDARRGNFIKRGFIPMCDSDLFASERRFAARVRWATMHVAARLLAVQKRAVMSANSPARKLERGEFLC